MGLQTSIHPSIISITYLLWVIVKKARYSIKDHFSDKKNNIVSSQVLDAQKEVSVTESREEPWQSFQDT